MTDRRDTLALTIRDALEDHADPRRATGGRGCTYCAGATAALDELLRLLEQRTQERDERDKWLEKACDDRDAAEQRVRELEAALADVCDLAIWMSGSDSFAPDGEAHEGWVKQREKLDAALTLADCNRRNRPEEK